MNTRTKKLLATLAVGSMMLGATGVALADTDSQATFSDYSNKLPTFDPDHDGDRDPHFGPDVPESQTWAMLGIGVGLIAFQLRRRTKKFQKSDLV